jgi:glycosyltransferase involved in cell wall biosynthesis
MDKQPLISVLIPVYNYENYLGFAIESVLAQDYPNIEIVVQDNQSTDNSYKVAMEYYAKYPEKMRVMRNVRNLMGGSQNIIRMINFTKGEYLFLFSADDVMKPGCISSCIEAALKYPSAGLVLVEREQINEDGIVQWDEYTPFYDRSFFIEGKKHLPVFMLTGITILSQTMVKRSAYSSSGGISMVYQVPTDWNLNFAVASVSDMIYIHKPLIQYRVHSVNDTAAHTLNHIQLVHHYGMILNFIDIAKNRGFSDVLARKEGAIKKLGQMSLRYSVQTALKGHFQSARNHLNFALIFDRELARDALFQLLRRHLAVNETGKEERMALLIDDLERGDYLLKRKISYKPPEGFIEIKAVD